MRRHWQHTSFCMGQCVSSCGSKRTLDSVPTTPDTENYPGLISSSPIQPARSVSGGSKTCQFSLPKENHHQRCHQQALALPSDQLTRSPAARFVSAFSQRKISTRRINPGGSPLQVTRHSSPSTLPLKITSLLSPAPVRQDGDMKGTPVKNYFRDTISSAKKSSKTVTFSEAVPSPNTSTRKKSFFSFTKTKSINKKEPISTHSEELGSQPQSPHVPKKRFFNRKSCCRSPTPVDIVTKPIKEKQICRVTLSLKHSSSKKDVGDLGTTEGGKYTNSEAQKKSNCDDFKGNVSDDSVRNPPKDKQTMGNVSSSSTRNAVEVVNHFKPVVKSSSVSLIKTSLTKSDINENVTLHHGLPSSKSAENPGVINDENHLSRNSEKVHRDLHSIKEENRLLRLKFFQEDSSKSANISSGRHCIDTQITPSRSSKMNRQNNIVGGRSAIPLPKSSASVKPVNNAPSIPKLYSVPSSDHEPTTDKAGSGNANSKVKLQYKDFNQQQPTNLNSGKWVPAAEFFVPPTTPSTTEASRPHTSPASARGNRRSSEPPRWLPGGSKIARDTKVPDAHLDRRGTVGYQPRKPIMTQNTSIPKVFKTVTTSEKSTAVMKNTTSKIGVRKPEETKPFYTLGLYQNRSKQTESTVKSFGVQHSGFHGVSTGIVRQRAQQYQTKVAESSKVTGDSKESTKEDHKSLPHMQESPSRPGVIRSATYTIRKHGLHATAEKQGQVDAIGVRPVKAKSDVDPRYLTWTRKGSVRDINNSCEMSKHSGTTVKKLQDSDSENAYDSRVGYPLQHNASATSTSSMGTNEDGIGDQAVISDSEYLIDDEISDQPDLTLTFKDSSLKLSSSSSGESLISCDNMLDHLDQNQRILGELTSDSAISDISSHKPVSQSSLDHISKICDAKALVMDRSPTVSDVRSSPIETSSPSSIHTVKNPKSPRRIAKVCTTPQNKMTVSNSRPSRQSSGEFSIHSSVNSSYKSSGNISAGVTPKQRTVHEPRVTAGRATNVRSVLTTSSSLSPVKVNQQKTPKKDNVAGLTIENVNKLHKQFEFADTVAEYITGSENERGLPVAFVSELLTGFNEVKDELEKLRMQLESQEKREREKDELIQRLTGEVDWLRLMADNKSTQVQHRNGNIIPTRSIESNDPTSPKERYINSLNYENAAVQTENNNLFNRAVSYPEDDDKCGELVRIGRSSSVKKKL